MQALGNITLLGPFGLHLVIIIFSWEMLLRSLPLPFLFKNLITLVLALLYALFTFSSISFIRALLTLIFYRFIVMAHRQINTVHIISLITFLVLLYNPIQLMFLDFQLSFWITFLLAWINQINTQHKNAVQNS